MTIKCFLGFHNWQPWRLYLNSNCKLINLKSCVNCYVTDMEVPHRGTHKYKRTSCLVSISLTERCVLNINILNENTLGEFYFEHYT
jgi:hypothetical protein